jgi:hypothetical protein
VGLANQNTYSSVSRRAPNSATRPRGADLERPCGHVQPIQMTTEVMRLCMEHVASVVI